MNPLTKSQALADANDGLDDSVKGTRIGELFTMALISNTILSWNRSIELCLEIIEKYNIADVQDFKDRVPYYILLNFVSHVGQRWESVVDQGVLLFRTRSYAQHGSDLYNVGLEFGRRRECTEEEKSMWTNYFMSNHISVEEFLYFLKRWINCEDPKKNTLWLYGSPNHGKTFLAKQICNPFTPFLERVSNQGLANEFAMSNVLGGKIVLWEEPFCDMSLAQDMKNLLAGEPVTVAKKFQSRQTLSRRPVLITSNYQDLQRGIALNSVEEAALDKRRFMWTFISVFKPAFMVPDDSFWCWVASL